MSLFQNQPAFCAICGTRGDYEISMDRPITCRSRACIEELNWRYTLYVMGKPYYPLRDLQREPDQRSESR